MNGHFSPRNQNFPSEFDRLAWLSANDPVAFEAERQARVAIEVAKSRSSTPETRELMHNLDRIMAPLSPNEKAWLSLRSMTISLVQLNEVLQGLSEGTRGVSPA